MSYMGPRFGGQIFPQNQNQSQPFQQNVQRQMQMMQMQLQLQQKIQNQLQKQYEIKADAQRKQNSGSTPSVNGQRAGTDGQNQSNQKQNQEQAPKPKPQQQQQQNQPSNKSQSNQNQGTNPRNINLPPNKNVGGFNQQNKGQGSQNNAGVTSNQAKNAGPQNVNKPGNLSNAKTEDKSAIEDKKNKPQYPNNPKGAPNPGQQGSLLGKPPGPPKPNPNNPPKTEVKQEKNQQQGSQGGYNQNYNQNQNQNYNQNYNEGGSWQGYGQNQGQGRGQQQPNTNRNQGRNVRNTPEQNANSSFNKPGGKNPPGGPGSGRPTGQGQGGGSGSYKPQGHQGQGGGYQGQSGGYQGQGGGSGPYKSQSHQGHQGQGQGGGSGPYKGKGYYGMEKIKEKVQYSFTEPLISLDPVDITEKKFNVYAKLFVGNVPKNCEQSDIVDLFKKYGEVGPIYFNKDSAFSFIHMDYKANAAKALRELDNTTVKNRYLKVRFATINEGIRVKNLSPYVSNELLEKCFSVFGAIDHCRVVVDDRGNPKGEGIIIFKEKKSALNALKKCQEDCYFLSGAMRPVVVTALEPSEDNVEGYPESLLPKNEEYHAERNTTPHFADRNSFEFEFGMQWKQLFNMYEEKKSTLDRDFQIEIERLEKKMVLAKVEYEAEKLRKELAQREAESAELRRHFDYGDNMSGSGNAMARPPSGPSSGGYDSYPSGTKRPIDQAYDSSFNSAYDGAYNDNYDRGYSTSADYDRGYDQQGYGAGYGREGYMREGASTAAGGGASTGSYGLEGGYDNRYERPNDISLPPERPLFDGAPEQSYKSNPPADAVVPGADTYASAAKRTRY